VFRGKHAQLRSSIFLLTSSFMLQYFGTMCHSPGRRNSGIAGEAVKELRAVETYKKIVSNMFVYV